MRCPLTPICREQSGSDPTEVPVPPQPALPFFSATKPAVSEGHGKVTLLFWKRKVQHLPAGQGLQPNCLYVFPSPPTNLSVSFMYWGPLLGQYSDRGWTGTEQGTVPVIPWFLGPCSAHNSQALQAFVAAQAQGWPWFSSVPTSAQGCPQELLPSATSLHLCRALPSRCWA